MQIDAVHGQLLGVLQIVQLCLCGRLAAVRFVQLDHLVFELGRLVRREFEFGHVGTVAVLVGIKVAQLRLDEIGAEQSMCDERAGQSTFENIVANLQWENKNIS